MSENEQKSETILDAALPVFVRLGFRKTSMADIARAAGMSRAALYLCFSSKEDLFRAGSTRAHGRTMRNVESELAGEDDVFSRIERAVAVFQRELIAPFAASGDAAELFDTNMTLARDITQGARTKLVALLAQALADAQASGAIAVEATPADVAAILVGAMEGIKDAQVEGRDLLADTQLFLRLLRQALTRNLPAG
ncbi:MAG: helix-turn-helix domain containing protein [bacterium]|nr:helix-turn-helix domain containing protein [bacterium]